MRRLFFLVSLGMFFIGCTNDMQSLITAGDHDATSDIDNVPTEGTMTDVDNFPTESKMVCTENTCYDPATDLEWQRTDSEIKEKQPYAIAYCSALELGGHTDWRLPTITELRTLIKGCSGTVAGGACPVQNPDCLANACYTEDCVCAEKKGPGENGFYWEKGIWDYHGDRDGAFWSVSTHAEEPTMAWGIYFYDGEVGYYYKDVEGYVRCVRDVEHTDSDEDALISDADTDTDADAACVEGEESLASGYVRECVLGEWVLRRVTKQWGTASGDSGNSVAVNTAGNIFVTGYTGGSIDDNASAGAQDIFLTKWNADGTKAWTKQWGTAGDDFDRSVAVDTAGNIFVIGYTYGVLDGNTNAGGADLFLTKWNVDGYNDALSSGFFFA